MELEKDDILKNQEFCPETTVQKQTMLDYLDTNNCFFYAQ
jgi:hypothetical protein